MNRLTPTELEQILYDAAECSCQHCQRVRRMMEHVRNEAKYAEMLIRENARLRLMLRKAEPFVRGTEVHEDVELMIGGPMNG